MPRILQITQVIRQSQQGKTEPLVCRCDDGERYYVKGQQTNRASLWAEWLCAHLARAFGLPVPPFALVELDDALLQVLPPAWRALGCLPAFASRACAAVDWLEPAGVAQVPAALRRDILVFDWWVHNADRTPGNPNLLWDVSRRELVVIDHNLAFDPDFAFAEFLQHHIFAAEWPALPHDWALQQRYNQRLVAALPAVQQALASLPQAWHWENTEQDVPARFDLERAMTTLSRCTRPDDFWSMG